MKQHMDNFRGCVLPALFPLRSCAGHKVQFHTAPFPFPPVLPGAVHAEPHRLTGAVRGSDLWAGFVPFCPFPGTELWVLFPHWWGSKGW